MIAAPFPASGQRLRFFTFRKLLNKHFQQLAPIYRPSTIHPLLHLRRKKNWISAFFQVPLAALISHSVFKFRLAYNFYLASLCYSSAAHKTMAR